MVVPALLKPVIETALTSRVNSLLRQNIYISESLARVSLIVIFRYL